MLNELRGVHAAFEKLRVWTVAVRAFEALHPHDLYVALAASGLAEADLLLLEKVLTTWPFASRRPRLALSVPLAPVEPAAYSAPPPVGSYAPDATNPEFDRFSVDDPPRVGHVLARGTTPHEVIARYAHDYATAVGYTQKHLADYKNAEGIPRRLRIQCGHSGKPAPCLKAYHRWCMYHLIVNISRTAAVQRAAASDSL
eukprot:jgi/Tetstr1/433851/TSEL_023034.t1